MMTANSPDSSRYANLPVIDVMMMMMMAPFLYDGPVIVKIIFALTIPEITRRYLHADLRANGVRTMRQTRLTLSRASDLRSYNHGRQQLFHGCKT